jgi:hypothetical protein
MPLDLKCPKCSHVFAVTEARHPVGVDCPSCDAGLTAEFRRVPVPAPGEAPYELLVKVGKPAAAAAGGRRARADDDGGGRRKGGSMAFVVIVAVTALVLTLGGLGTAGYFMFNEDGLDTSDYSSSSRPRTSGGGSVRPGAPGGFTPPNNFPGGNDPFKPPTPPPKPKVDRFSLNPVTGPVPRIGTPIFNDQTTHDLGGKVGAVAVGGGGRYIVMHFPDKGLLGVFDLSTGQMAGGVAADQGDVKMTAGLSRVVTYVRGSEIMRVYNLPDLGKVFDTDSPHKGLKAIAMGSKTNGPMLVVGTFGDVELLDVSGNAVTKVEGSLGKPGNHWNIVRAAPDGRAFATFDGYNPGHRVILLTESGGRWQKRDLDQVPFPGTDGRFYGNGVISDRNGRTTSVGVGVGSGNWVVPSLTSSHYLKVVTSRTGVGARTKHIATVTFYNAQGNEVPGAPTPDLGEADGGALLDRFGRLPQPLDQHLFLVPEAKVLAVLNHDRTKLTLRKVELR